MGGLRPDGQALTTLSPLTPSNPDISIHVGVICLSPKPFYNNCRVSSCTKSGVFVHGEVTSRVSCTKRPVFVHGKVFSEVSCTKRAVFVHGKVFSEVSCTKSGVFVHGKVFSRVSCTKKAVLVYGRFTCWFRIGDTWRQVPLGEARSVWPTACWKRNTCF